jgi:hypothetical protein
VFGILFDKAFILQFPSFLLCYQTCPIFEVVHDPAKNPAKILPWVLRLPIDESALVTRVCFRYSGGEGEKETSEYVKVNGF